MQKNILPSVFAFIGVVIFSFSFPATKMAIDVFDAYSLLAYRTLIASAIASIVIIKNKKTIRQLSLEQIKFLIIQTLCVVVGFPFLSSLALSLVNSSHAALTIAFTPILTAAISTLITKRKRSFLFWLIFLVSTLTTVFTILFSQELSLSYYDLILFLASLVVAIGYNYGSILSRQIGGVLAISISILIGAPFSVLYLTFKTPTNFNLTYASLFSLVYLGTMSMFVGFIFWYKGLSEGKTENISLIQALQLFLTYFWSWLFLNESISISQMLASVVIAACIIFVNFVK